MNKHTAKLISLTDKLTDTAFANADQADRALAANGFSLVSAFGVWRSKDGLIDAHIRQRTDGHYIVVLFA